MAAAERGSLTRRAAVRSSGPQPPPRPAPPVGLPPEFPVAGAVEVGAVAGVMLPGPGPAPEAGVVELGAAVFGCPAEAVEVPGVVDVVTGVVLLVSVDCEGAVAVPDAVGVLGGAVIVDVAWPAWCGADWS